MFLQEDGSVLEKGAMTNPATGEVEDYEELWEDLEAEPAGLSGARRSIVLRREEGRLRGMVARLGTWCQGILKDDEGRLTVERWQWLNGDVQQPAEQSVQLDEAGVWKCIFRVGSGKLPCQALCSESSGHRPTEKTHNKVYDGWEVIEDYTF